MGEGEQPQVGSDLEGSRGYKVVKVIVWISVFLGLTGGFWISVEIAQAVGYSLGAFLGVTLAAISFVPATLVIFLTLLVTLTLLASFVLPRRESGTA